MSPHFQELVQIEIAQELGEAVSNLLSNGVCIHSIAIGMISAALTMWPDIPLGQQEADCEHSCNDCVSS